MGETYPRVWRITRRSDFERVAEKGTRIHTEAMSVRYIASPFGHLRVGLVVPLYGHSAVERNRLKRRIRDIVRRTLLIRALHWDVVMRVRPQAYSYSFRRLNSTIEKIGLTLLSYQVPTELR